MMNDIVSEPKQPKLCKHFRAGTALLLVAIVIQALLLLHSTAGDRGLEMKISLSTNATAVNNSKSSPDYDSPYLSNTTL